MKNGEAAVRHEIAVRLRNQARTARGSVGTLTSMREDLTLEHEASILEQLADEIVSPADAAAVRDRMERALWPVLGQVVTYDEAVEIIKEPLDTPGAVEVGATMSLLGDLTDAALGIEKPESR